METRKKQINHPHALKTKWILFLVLCVTFIAYSSSLENDFTKWDDEGHLSKNVAVRSLSAGNIKKIFSSTVAETYIPLTVLSYSLEHYFFGFNAFIYHFDNLLLHLGVTALVFWLALRIGLSLRAAALAALFFGVHPMHVESVAWITERKDVLYACFYMLAVHSYWTYLGTHDKKAYFFSILFGALSILSKAMALSLPLILFICDWLYQRKFDRTTLLDKIPHFLYIVPITLVTYLLNARTIKFHFIEGTLTGVWCALFYIRKFFFPFELVPLYQRPEPVSILNYPYALSVGVLMFLLFCLIRYRKNRWLLFAFLWYFFSMFFLFRVDAIADLNIVADRFMYLPCLGICLFLGVSFEKFLEKSAKHNIVFQRTAVLCLVIVLTSLTMKTYLQNKIWKNNFTLWNYVVEKTPGSAIAYNNRGAEYKIQGHYDLALIDYNKATEIDPNYEMPYVNRGIIHEKNGQQELALTEYNKAAEVAPNFPKTYINRGLVYKDKGQYKLAFNDFSRAIQLDSDYTKAYVNRGTIYEVDGRNDLALTDYNKAIEIDPYSPEAYINRAVVYQKERQYDRTLADYSKAVEIDPSLVDIYINRGILYKRQGQHALALADFNKVFAIDPKNAKAYINRGTVYGVKGQHDMAIADFSRALKIDPENATAYYNRSRAYAAKGNFPMALEDVLKSKSLGFEIDETYMENLQSQKGIYSYQKRKFP